MKIIKGINEEIFSVEKKIKNGLKFFELLLKLIKKVSKKMCCNDNLNYVNLFDDWLRI